MMELDEDEAAFVKSLDLLTYKPVIYAANVSEDDAADDAEENEYVKAVRDIADAEGSQVVIISAQVEAELADIQATARDEQQAKQSTSLATLVSNKYRYLVAAGVGVAAGPWVGSGDRTGASASSEADGREPAH